MLTNPRDAVRALSQGHQTVPFHMLGITLTNAARVQPRNFRATVSRSAEGPRASVAVVSIVTARGDRHWRMR